VLVPVIVAV
jgi:hypothetical protein